MSALWARVSYLTLLLEQALDFLLYLPCGLKSEALGFCLHLDVKVLHKFISQFQ